MKRINDHGSTHSARVCILVTLLANALEVSPSDTVRLQIAATLHDIGRTGHRTDARHGEASVRKASELGFVLDTTIIDIISYHSRGDRVARHLSDSTKKLLWILKDADALDRVRTGDLDERYLRFPESASLIEYARTLYETRTEH